MARYPTKELRKIAPILNRHGYRLARTSGSHFVFVNPVTGKHKTVNKDLNPIVGQRLLKELETEMQRNERRI